VVPEPAFGERRPGVAPARLAGLIAAPLRSDKGLWTGDRNDAGGRPLARPRRL